MVAAAFPEPLSRPRPRLWNAPPARPTVKWPELREVIGTEQLLDAINRELAARQETASVRVGAGRWEIAEYSAGCNWSESSLIVCVHGSAGPEVFAVLRQVIADVRARYNVVTTE